MKLFRIWLPLAVLGGFPLLQAQTSIDLRTQAKSVDFSSAAFTKPSKVGTVLPAACSVGETYFKSDAPPGRNLYGCTSTNSWALLGSNLWFGATGTNSRQILGPAGSFSGNFNYRWADTTPTAATLMKIGAPSSGESSIGPANPDTDYVTPSGNGAVQNKILDSSNLFSSYSPWAQISKPGAPAVGFLRLYAKIGAGLCWLNSAGTETCAGNGTFSDPGGTGVVVETSPGVTTNRTITAGSGNISITSGSGATGNPMIDIGSAVDFSGKTTSPVQVGTTAGIPLTCSTGQLYFASDGLTGRKLQTCSAANTWTAIGYEQGSATPGFCSLGQVYFNTSATAGQNLFFCTAANTWTQMHGGVSTAFGRTGAVTAQAGDYLYTQISNTPAAMPPNGAATGDLGGTYPNPLVSQVNGAAIPSSGILKANGSRQLIQATAGSDYMAVSTPLQAAQLPALTGDCTTMAGSIATNCTKTNGTAFAASATTDTTNAASISTGILSAARLPATAMQSNQSNTISGGTQDFHGAAHTLPAVTGLAASKPANCAVGEVYFATDTTPGQNQFYCTATNAWTQQTGSGTMTSLFGRTGAVIAQTGDYTYLQINNTPIALPPNGTASGDLSGPYPNPTVAQVNGAAIPTGGMLKANGSRQIVPAVSGSDYAPATSGTSLLRGNGSGGFGGASAADVVNLFASCSGTQYLGADGLCHAPGGSGSGYVVLTTGAGAPPANCVAPSTTNLAIHLDSANGDEWWCYATNSWKKLLSVAGSGPYSVTGGTGGPPIAPTSGNVTCYFDNTTNTQVCLDSGGNAFTMLKGAAATAHQFLTNVDAAGLQHPVALALGDMPTGSALTIASGNSVLGTASIVSYSCAPVVTTVASGAMLGDGFAWYPGGSLRAVTGYAPASTGGLSISQYLTTGAVNFDVCNWTAAAITPGPVTLYWRIAR